MSLKQYNKVIVNNQTIIDLTSDTVTSESLLLGRIAHSSDGSVITGSYLTDYFNLLLDNNSDVLTDSSGNQYTGDIGYISQADCKASKDELSNTIISNTSTISILNRQIAEMQTLIEEYEDIIENYDSVAQGFLLDSDYQRISTDVAGS